MWRAVILVGFLAVAFALHGEEHDNLPSWEPGMKEGKIPIEDDVTETDEPGSDVGSRLFVDLLPPKNKPGEVLDTTSEKEVNRALDEVLKSTAIMHDRSCAIGSANVQGSQLVNPRFYLKSGMAAAVPPFEVNTGETSLKLFVKKDWTLTGSVGVVTYDIVGTDHKVAILWSVPFDWNLYDVWFNVKVYPQDYPTAKHMYDQMYYYAGPWRARGWESREEYGVKITTSMTHNIHAKLQLYVDTTDYSPEAPVEIHADCSYHAGWVRYYCWRECRPGGYCWTDKRCNSKADCSGDMPCYKSCSKTN